MSNSGILFNPSLLEKAQPRTKDRIPEPLPPSRANLELVLRCLDLTSLNATDTNAGISALLEKALATRQHDGQSIAAVCVFQPFIPLALSALAHTRIAVATVAGGFPHGQQDLYLKVEDVSHSVQAGAAEIDLVINRSYALTGAWKSVYQEVAQCKRAARKAKLKVILATGELATENVIYNASMTCMMAGADFIKTSTGFETVNATLSAGLAMSRAISTYYKKTGLKVGLKAAGGIRTVQEALAWLALVQETLGEEWLRPELFRIGASSLLGNLESALKAV